MNIIRPIPVAKQVNEILRNRLRDGTYVPGMRLPSESELADEFDVSRATVRTVLARLEVEGLILRKQGDGTYINEHISDVNTHLGGLWEFSLLIESSGYKPTIECILIESRPASERESYELALEERENVLSLKRRFFADDEPVILATNAIPIRILQIDVNELDGQLKISDFLERYCHRKIAYAISDIRAALLPPEDETIFKQFSDPLLNIYITFYDRDNRPLMFGNNYYDASILRLSSVQAWY